MRGRLPRHVTRPTRSDDIVAQGSSHAWTELELPRRTHWVDLDLDDVLGAKPPLEQELGQGIFDTLLDGPLERSRIDDLRQIEILERDARDFDRAVADLKKEAAEHNAQKLLIELEDAAHTKITTSGNYPSALTSTFATLP